MVDDALLTPAIMYRAAAVVALLDVLLAVELSRRVGTERLRAAKCAVAAVSGVFWFGIWLTIGAIIFWEPVYGRVFPAWARWFIPPVYGLGFAGVGALWRYLALKAPRAAVPVFVALWGLTGAITHAYAIHFLGLISNVPMLRLLTPASACTFATAEFAFYGCVILGVSALAQRAWERRRGAGAERGAERGEDR